MDSERVRWHLLRELQWVFVETSDRCCWWWGRRCCWWSHLWVIMSNTPPPSTTREWFADWIDDGSSGDAWHWTMISCQHPTPTPPPTIYGDHPKQELKSDPRVHRSRLCWEWKLFPRSAHKEPIRCGSPVREHQKLRLSHPVICECWVWCVNT